MAIEVMPFITLILRVHTPREVSAAGWRYLFHTCDPSRNFDGEIMVFGAMSGRDIQSYTETLISFGFTGPNNGDSSDMVIWDFMGSTDMPNWLSVVDVTFFDGSKEPCRAWKFTNSEVYELINFETKFDIPTKGYQCDWPPLIGKI